MSFLLAMAAIAISGQMIKEVAMDVMKVPARSFYNGNFNVIKNFESILKICKVK